MYNYWYLCMFVRTCVYAHVSSHTGHHEDDDATLPQTWTTGSSAMPTLVEALTPSHTEIRRPQDALYAVLSIGMVVIKHGMDGRREREGT